MRFKDQMFNVVSSTTNKELLNSYQTLRAKFEDDLLKFKEGLTDTQCQLFDSILLEGVDALIDYSERLYFDRTFEEVCKVWRELLFDGDLLQLLDLGKECDDIV